MDDGKRLTIKDVARAAGVSTQTISRVINNHPDVASETRVRVQEVLDQVGYQPSASARNLSRQASRALGVVASGHEYYGPSGMAVVGIERQANELGYSLILQLMHGPEIPQVSQVINSLTAQDVEGIVWAVPEIGGNREWFKGHPARFHVPIVFLSMAPSAGLRVIAIDNRAGARMATEHLLARGCRKLGFIGGPDNWWEVSERRLGWQDALSAHGLRPDGCQAVSGGDWTPATGERGLCALLEQYPEMDGLFAANDHIALGALKVAHERGLRIPEDLAMVGFDNRPESAYFYPPLTTVGQPLNEVGSLAVRELHRAIRSGGQSHATAEPGAIALQPHLIVRASSDRAASPAGCDAARKSGY